MKRTALLQQQSFRVVNTFLNHAVYKSTWPCEYKTFRQEGVVSISLLEYLFLYKKHLRDRHFPFLQAASLLLHGCTTWDIWSCFLATLSSFKELLSSHYGKVKCRLNGLSVLAVVSKQYGASLLFPTCDRCATGGFSVLEEWGNPPWVIVTVYVCFRPVCPLKYVTNAFFLHLSELLIISVLGFRSHSVFTNTPPQDTQWVGPTAGLEVVTWRCSGARNNN